MPTVINNNLRMIDLPVWEQLQPAPVASSAGASMTDDDERFIYYLSSATSFWRYDTWSNVWQQLANPTGGTVGVGTVIRFNKQIGGQFNNVVYGSILALITNGVATPVLNKYDIATNTWTALSVSGLPATFGTDSSLSFPNSYANNNLGGFSGSYTITTTGALVNATTLPCSALPKALSVGTVLNFGTLSSPKYAVLTASAIATATSLTVAPLLNEILSSDTAIYSDSLYLIGNATAQIYRYSLGSNTWTTTADIGGSPTIPVAPAVSGAGLNLTWLSGYNNDYLYFIRGANTNAMYRYQLSTNTWSAVIDFQPKTELLTTGTTYSLRKNNNGQSTSLLIHLSNSMKVYEFNPTTLRLDPKMMQYLLATGAGLVGDKMCCLKSPEGIEFNYMLLSTSTSFVRSPIIF
jgi:hypothetical protein